MDTKEIGSQVWLKRQSGQRHVFVRWLYPSTRLANLIRNEVDGGPEIRKDGSGNLVLRGVKIPPSSSWIKLSVPGGQLMQMATNELKFN